MKKTLTGSFNRHICIIIDNAQNKTFSIYVDNKEVCIITQSRDVQPDCINNIVLWISRMRKNRIYIGASNFADSVCAKNFGMLSLDLIDTPDDDNYKQRLIVSKINDDEPNIVLNHLDREGNCDKYIPRKDKKSLTLQGQWYNWHITH